MSNSKPTIDELLEELLLAEQNALECQRDIRVAYKRLDQLEEKIKCSKLAIIIKRITRADAHEIWVAAQLLPGEGIEDGVKRVERVLSYE